MAITSGSSHASAAFVSILLGSVISELLGTHGGLFYRGAALVGNRVGRYLGVPLAPETVGLLTIAVVLSFLWGVAYHHARHG